MPRKSITDMIPDIETPQAVPQAPEDLPPAQASPPPPVAQEEDRGPAKPASRRAPRPQRPAKAARPTARDLAAPAKQSIAREALKADVPADLALLQRLRRYRLDTGIDIRDQVAIAVDEWLTSQGY
jgi:hypothetical protein